MAMTDAILVEKVDTIIERFGQSVVVRKVSEEGEPNRYNQTADSYESITCTGRAITKPTKQQITVFGDGVDVDLMVLFARQELIEKFPEGVEPQWITKRDRIQFEGREYNIDWVKPSARLKEYYSLVVIGCSLPSKVIS